MSVKIFGQDPILKYLNSGIERKLLHHSLLFVGPDGVGKKKVALEIVAPALSQGNSADVLLLNRAFQAAILKEKVESQSALKIESVRHIDNFLHLKSMIGAHRVVIIEEANKLTNDAANALLKLLEEPPNSAQLILLSNDEHSLPATVVSRCAVLRFKLIPSLGISRWLVHEKGIPLDEAELVAERAAGSFSKAIEFLESDEETKGISSLSSLNRREFFEALEESAFRKDPRNSARQLIDRLMIQSQKNMIKGDLKQAELVRAYLNAKRQIDHYVPPRFVLENLYLTYEKILSNNTHLLR